jgi:outer membrane protein assembly factor BamB
MMELGPSGDARLVWSSQGGNEIKSDKLHTLMSQPVIEGDYIYGICSYGQLRCLRRSTGERIWETQAVTVEKARNATAWMISNQSRMILLNDRGELILAKFAPSGYEEIGRTKVIEPTSPPGARRELGAVIWSHPAFANGHMVVRNDREAIRISLQKRDYGQ